MPHLRFKAVPEKIVSDLSQTLPKELASVLQTSEDNFSFELVSSNFYENGQKTSFYPFVEFAWFDRGQKVQDQVAQIIYHRVKEVFPADYITLVFLDLPKTSYYENGQHFGA